MIITTKELGQKSGVSQQSASYIINNLTSKNIIRNYQTIIDPAKFGLINILVLYNYLNFNKKETDEVKNVLEKNPYIIAVEETSQGADLLAEFCVPNLSLFNKQSTEILSKYKSIIRLADTFVVIVKHIYEKKYLVRTSVYDEIIISGDRDVSNLNETQHKLLEILRDNAKTPITTIAGKLGLDPKTLLNVKKQLENKKIIRKYTALFDHQKLGINRTLLLLELDYEEQNNIDRLIEFTKQHKNVVEAAKLIGKYSISLIIEDTKISKEPIKDIRKNFNITNYAILESDGLVTQKYVPDSVFK